MSDRFPQLNWHTLPKEEMDYGLHLEVQLRALSMYCDQFQHALELFDENTATQTREHGGIMREAARATMAANHAVLSLYHFRSTLYSIKHLLGQSPTLREKVDATRINEVLNEFGDNFPDLKNVRDGVGHFADRMFKPEKIEEHSGPDGFFHGTIIGRSLKFSFENTYVSIEISAGSLSLMLRAKNAAYSEFLK